MKLTLKPNGKFKVELFLLLVEFHFRTTIRLGTNEPAPITVLKLGSILIKERKRKES
ncbi:MAG: hypothetical protein QN720_07800 [Nitrososphaeraceae archaeon]|nr:hypothetical protein [Nitrososphaeraceae archaeon]MDW0331910.1 hypothetical protein [Nitrososphaeraceae archaeon]